MTLNDEAPRYQVAPHKSLDLKDEVTLEAWIQADSMSQAGGRILDKSVPGTNNGYLFDTFPGNSLRFITANGAVNFDAKLPGDKWTHVVAVYSSSGKTQKIFMNGKQVAAKTDGAFPPLIVTQLPFSVGADPNGANRFQGRIRRAAIYGRALTTPEIAQRFNNSAPLSGVLGE